MSDSFKLELTDHPAQARHPFTNEPLIADGKPVPLFPKEKAVRLDGRIIAYVTASQKVSFIVDRKTLGPIADKAIEFVKKEMGEIQEVHAVVEPQEESDE